MNDDHIPVPLEHTPNTEAIQQADDDLLIVETNNWDDAWVLCKSGTVTVEQ